MTTIEKNYQIWNSEEHWEHGIFGDREPLLDGEKWSRPWGHSRYQWLITILPRIYKNLPTKSILEIACGRGRWTQYLLPMSEMITLVELSENNIEYCKKRFINFSNIKYIKNDGKSLDGVNDNCIDFVFSYDSLVHSDEETLESYIKEISRVLKNNGEAFIHSSNLAGIVDRDVKNNHMRDNTCSAEKVIKFATKYKLNCYLQELIPWDNYHIENKIYIDVYSFIAKTKNQASTKIIENETIKYERMVANWMYDNFKSNLQKA